MKRLALIAVMLSLAAAQLALAQGWVSRSDRRALNRTVPPVVDARGRAVAAADQPNVSLAAGCARWPAPCVGPRADRPGCDDRQAVRQSAGDGRDPGALASSPARRDRVQPGSGARRAAAWPCSAPPPRGACIGSPELGGTVAPSPTDVDAATADALRAALIDEQRAQAFYEAVMRRHGRVRPFVNIVRAEERHAEVLRLLLARHGLAAPSRGGELAVVPNTLGACSELAATLERENVAMYDRLLADVREPDVRAVFERLRAVSKRRHLPAFERWAGPGAPDESWCGGRGSP